MFKAAMRSISLALILCLASEQAGFAQAVPYMPIPAYINGYVAPDRFRPVQLRSLSFDSATQNFDLFLDPGDARKIAPKEIELDTKLLMNYFRIGLALPNTAFWVNLRPDAPLNIIDPSLEKTDLGKVMLASDLELKKSLARFTSPKTEEGKKYWNQLYAKAEQLFGSEDITIPTVTRPWIVPGEVIIRETSSGCHILKATLKVCLEEDHIKDGPALNFDDPRLKELNEYSSQLIRDIVIPKLTREVNSSKKFASLRQAFYSLILAQWFKEKHRGGEGYYAKSIDSGNLEGLEAGKRWSKETYFKAYKRSFERGEYNLSQTTQSSSGAVVRQYVSGGITGLATSLTPQSFVSGASTGLRVTAQDGGIAPRGMLHVNPAGAMIDYSPEQVEATAKDGGKQSLAVSAINFVRAIIPGTLLVLTISGTMWTASVTSNALLTMLAGVVGTFSTLSSLGIFDFRYYLTAARDLVRDFIPASLMILTIFGTMGTASVTSNPLLTVLVGVGGLFATLGSLGMFSDLKNQKAKKEKDHSDDRTARDGGRDRGTLFKALTIGGLLIMSYAELAAATYLVHFTVQALGIFHVFFVNSFYGAASVMLSDSFSYPDIWINLGISSLAQLALIKATSILGKRLSWTITGSATGIITGLIGLTFMIGTSAFSPFNLSNLVIFYGPISAAAGALIGVTARNTWQKAGGGLGLIAGVLYTSTLLNWMYPGLPGLILAAGQLLAPTIGAALGMKLFSINSSVLGINDSERDADSKDEKADGGMTYKNFSLEVAEGRVETGTPISVAYKSGSRDKFLFSHVASPEYREDGIYVIPGRGRNANELIFIRSNFIKSIQPNVAFPFTARDGGSQRRGVAALKKYLATDEWRDSLIPEARGYKNILFARNAFFAVGFTAGVAALITGQLAVAIGLLAGFSIVTILFTKLDFITSIFGWITYSAHMDMLTVQFQLYDTERHRIIIPFFNAYIKALESGYYLNSYGARTQKMMEDDFRRRSRILQYDNPWFASPLSETLSDGGVNTVERIKTNEYRRLREVTRKTKEELKSSLKILSIPVLLGIALIAVGLLSPFDLSSSRFSSTTVSLSLITGGIGEFFIAGLSLYFCYKDYATALAKQRTYEERNRILQASIVPVGEARDGGRNAVAAGNKAFLQIVKDEIKLYDKNALSFVDVIEKHLGGEELPDGFSAQKTLWLSDIDSSVYRVVIRHNKDWEKRLQVEIDEKNSINNLGMSWHWWHSYKVEWPGYDFFFSVNEDHSLVTAKKGNNVRYYSLPSIQNNDRQVTEQGDGGSLSDTRDGGKDTENRQVSEVSSFLFGKNRFNQGNRKKTEERLSKDTDSSSDGGKKLSKEQRKFYITYQTLAKAAKNKEQLGGDTYIRSLILGAFRNREELQKFGMAVSRITQGEMVRQSYQPFFQKVVIGLGAYGVAVPVGILFGSALGTPAGLTAGALSFFISAVIFSKLLPRIELNYLKQNFEGIEYYEFYLSEYLMAALADLSIADFDSVGKEPPTEFVNLLRAEAEKYKGMIEQKMSSPTNAQIENEIRYLEEELQIIAKIIAEKETGRDGGAQATDEKISAIKQRIKTMDLFTGEEKNAAGNLKTLPQLKKFITDKINALNKDMIGKENTVEDLQKINHKPGQIFSPEMARALTLGLEIYDLEQKIKTLKELVSDFENSSIARIVSNKRNKQQQLNRIVKLLMQTDPFRIVPGSYFQGVEVKENSRAYDNSLRAQDLSDNPVKALYPDWESQVKNRKKIFIEGSAEIIPKREDTVALRQQLRELRYEYSEPSLDGGSQNPDMNDLKANAKNLRQLYFILTFQYLFLPLAGMMVMPGIFGATAFLPALVGGIFFGTFFLITWAFQAERITDGLEMYTKNSFYRDWGKSRFYDGLAIVQVFSIYGTAGFTAISAVVALLNGGIIPAIAYVVLYGWQPLFFQYQINKTKTMAKEVIGEDENLDGGEAKRLQGQELASRQLDNLLRKAPLSDSEQQELFDSLVGKSRKEVEMILRERLWPNPAVLKAFAEYSMNRIMREMDSKSILFLDTQHRFTILNGIAVLGGISFAGGILGVEEYVLPGLAMLTLGFIGMRHYFRKAFIIESVAKRLAETPIGDIVHEPKTTFEERPGVVTFRDGGSDGDDLRKEARWQRFLEIRREEQGLSGYSEQAEGRALNRMAEEEGRDTTYFYNGLTHRWEVNDPSRDGGRRLDNDEKKWEEAKFNVRYNTARRIEEERFLAEHPGDLTASDERQIQARALTRATGDSYIVLNGRVVWNDPTKDGGLEGPATDITTIRDFNPSDLDHTFIETNVNIEWRAPLPEKESMTIVTSTLDVAGQAQLVQSIIQQLHELLNKGSTPGGIDFIHVLPAASLIPAALQVVQPGAPMASLEELDRQWLDIQEKIKQGEMPYKELKELSTGCCGRKDAAQQKEAVAEYVMDLLKLEEERAIATSEQLKEIVTLAVS